MFPAIAISERLRREILGVCLVVAALLSSWALGRGNEDGQLIHWLATALRGGFGAGAFLVPAFIALAAVRAFARQTEPVLLFRHYVGGALFFAGVLGLLALSGGESMGGAIGVVVGDITRGVFGQIASGIILLASGLVAVFLLADTDLQALERDIRVLVPKRKKALSEGTSAPPVPTVQTSGLRGRPVAEPAVVERVINLPKSAAKVQAPQQPARPAGISVEPAGEPMPLPDMRLLPYYDSVAPDAGDLEQKARTIEETLGSFKVEARVREINPGPAVTQFALEPGNGVKVRRIVELQHDLALSLAAQSIRVEAPIPGMARVGIEIPNSQIAIVGLREVLESPAFAESKAKLPLPLGRDVNGRYVVGDLAKMPHLLIAGATGAG
ncbi:MAG: DNA translocase FtsK 4TM domain-containing protein, partial [Gemmatimonadota bacterium]|nr:DNA translocase FtsK 4TM domain-containing protein [Gemmatimonadota bacterium]